MPHYLLFAASLVLVGLSSLTFLNSCNTMVQTSVPPKYRARVLALYLMVVQGGTPLGAPLVGWIAELLGVRAAVAFGAILSLLVSVLALIIWQRFRADAVPLRTQFKEIILPHQRREGTED